MQSQDIEPFFAPKAAMSEEYMRITFKQRKAIYGLLLKGDDYADLKAKNFWRIVLPNGLQACKASKDAGLVKGVNGEEFSRLINRAESFA